MKTVASIAFAALAFAASAEPPPGTPHNLPNPPLPKFDRSQSPQFKSVPVVLRVSYVSETSYLNGTRWRTARIREILKNRTTFHFGDSVRVAAVKERTRGYDGSEMGASAFGESEFILYLSRYAPPRDDQWLLISSENVRRE